MEKITITKEQAGKRIDKFLSTEFFSSRKTMLRDKFSRGDIIRKIKSEGVLVNGKNVKPSYVLTENDEIILPDSEKERDDELLGNDKIKLEILFEDENIVAINKQAGVQVHPSHNEKNNTIVNALVAKYPEIKNVHDDSEEGKMRPGIVHRLDKDTSGVMVIARNLKTFEELKKLFKSREISKKYIAICQGIFSEKEDVIKKPIARASSYRKQVVAGRKTKTKIRPAETQYKVIKEYKDFSLVEAMPKTGRMHQIRLHLASIDHPVAGDLIYGSKKASVKAKRQLLHAKELKFNLFCKEYAFSAPIPADFKDFLAKVDPALN